MRVNLPDEDDAQVQMAPLIDCVFLLLIFFLVATTIKKINRELPVTLPYSDAAVEVRQELDTLVLGLDRYGKLYVNAEPATTSQLFEKVRQAKAKNLPVRLDADQDTAWRHVIEVMEMCAIEGVRDVKFHTRREQAEK